MIDAGMAWFSVAAPALPDPAVRGRVGAVFRHAVYLRLNSRILAVGSGDIPPGPLHLRTPRFAAVTLAVGDRVTFEAGRLQVGGLDVEVRGEHRWAPPVADASALRAASEAWLAADRPVGDPPEGSLVAARSVARGDLEAAADALAGRGPGLTPAGDDVLAGILVVDAVLRPEDEALRRALAARAGSRTNDVAAAFLRAAAAGQSIGPVHDLLVAVAAGDHRATAAARAELTGIGASSGTALLHGLKMALA